MLFDVGLNFNAKPSPKNKIKTHESDSDDDFNYEIDDNPLISRCKPKRVDHGYACYENNFEVKLKDLSTNKNLPDNSYINALIIFKSDIKMSKNNKKFFYWTLRDFDNDPMATAIHDVNIFLFSDAAQKLWKLPIGSSISVNNPNIMKNLSQFDQKNKFALSINDPTKVVDSGLYDKMILCKGTNLNGGIAEMCKNYINKIKTVYCVKHLQAQLKKTINKRMELNPLYGASSRPLITSYNKQDNLLLYKMDIKPQLQPQPVNSSQSITNHTLHHLKHYHTSVSTNDKNNINRRNLPKFVTHPSVPKATTKGIKPMMGRGLNQSNDYIDFDMLKSTAKCLKSPPKLTIHEKNDKDLQNIKFSQKVDNNDGPLQKNNDVTSDKYIVSNPVNKTKGIYSKLALKPVDPNSIKPKLNEEFLNKVKRKLAPKETMPKKNKMVLGKIMESDELQRILSQKSQHIDLVQTQNMEREESYFQALECSETVRSSLGSIMEMPCTVVTCSLCKYTYWSAAEKCRKFHKAALTYAKGTKRFFHCKSCKFQTTTHLIYPDKSCNHCQTYNYERIPMYKSFDENVLKPEEKLHIRGEKVSKFLNSSN